MTNSGDLLNGGSTNGFRAPYVPGFGTAVDWGLAAFDIRNVFHFSGGYELPVGKGKYFLGKSNRVTEAALGNWSLQYLVTLQNGQPVSISCPIAVTSGTSCNALRVQGQDPKAGYQSESPQATLRTCTGLTIRQLSNSLASMASTVLTPTLRAVVPL